MKRALLLIDIQNEYFKGGKNPLAGPEEAAANARRALDFFRRVGMPVIHVRHVNIRPGAVTFLPDAKGSEIHGSVAPLEGERVVVKHYPSAFLQTGLADDLERLEITELVVCGMMSHMCVDTTVRAAQDHRLAVTLLEDACATKDLTWDGEILPAGTVHRTFMASLNGMFARVMRTDDFLKESEG